MVKVTVDDKEIQIEEGKSLLQGCLGNGIYVPNLCFLEEMTDPPTSCRLCFVEVEGQGKPVTACTVQPFEGMVVRTDTPAVRRLQRTALRLLLTVHTVECGKCPSNKRCDLQRMAKLLSVRLRPRRLEHLDRALPVDGDHPLFEIKHDRCVLCGKCVFVCKEQTGRSLLTFAQRGLDTIITSFGVEGSEDVPCNQCLACIRICPVSAISLKEPRQG